MTIMGNNQPANSALITFVTVSVLAMAIPQTGAYRVYPSYGLASSDFVDENLRMRGLGAISDPGSTSYALILI